MKYIFLSILFSSFCLLNCHIESSDTLSARYKVSGACCSNLERLNQEMIFSDVVGYRESILQAIDIDRFSNIELKDGSPLSIQFEFSKTAIPCSVICNRQMEYQ